MANSEAEVANLALGFIGDSTTIQDLDTEQSAQARACRLFYVPSRDEAFEDFPWPDVKRRVELSLVDGAENDDWPYAYRHPVGVARIIQIVGAGRMPTLSAMNKYTTGSDTTGRLIFCDVTNAELEYVPVIEDVSQWKAGFAKAVAYLLASNIAMRLVKEDKIGMSERMEVKYWRQLNKVRANAANQQRLDPPPESEIITSRQ